MMRVLWRAAAIMLLLTAGLVILFSVFRFLSRAHRLLIKRGWSRLLLLICGISIRFPGGRSLPKGPLLVVMNHVSWLDIFVLNALMPCTFIAKSEIRRWPFVGWLVAGSGTVFIERGSRHAVRHVNHEIFKRMSNGEIIAFFPEGSTSEGASVLPFHASLFAMAIADSNSGRPSARVVPVAVQYFQNGLRSTIPAYVGQQTLVDSIVRILSARQLSVQLSILEPIDPGPSGMTRQGLADMAQQKIGDVIKAVYQSR